jgi:hypothetical protein
MAMMAAAFFNPNFAVFVSVNAKSNLLEWIVLMTEID